MIFSGNAAHQHCPKYLSMNALLISLFFVSNYVQVCEYFIQDVLIGFSRSDYSFFFFS